MSRDDAENLWAAIRAVRRDAQPAAMATVIRVLGNAYRREGARMLIRADGSYACMLSGGCLEPAVVEAAQQVMVSGEPQLHHYELTDDLVWGLGIGCGGAVDVLIEPLHDDEVTNRWLSAQDLGQASVLVTALPGATGRVLVLESGEVVGKLPDDRSHRTAVEDARARLEARDPVSGIVGIGGTDYFLGVVSRPLGLTVFGAGHDAVPLVRLARTLGIAVTVVDPREAFLTADRFPAAALVHVEAGAMAEAVRLEAYDYVLVMNHHMARDRESLRVSFESAAHYIGVLGPRSRYDRLLDGLADEGYVAPSERLRAVRNPVGLALGADTPEEVSVSVLGEILAVHRGFRGGFLREWPGRIHGTVPSPDLTR